MLEYGQAKFEFIANIPRIKLLLNKGLTKLQIYKTLKKQGKINFKQRCFYNLINKHIPNNEINVAVTQNQKVLDNQVDLEELIEEKEQEEATQVVSKNSSKYPPKQEEAQHQSFKKESGVEAYASDNGKKEKKDAMLKGFDFDPRAPYDTSRL